MAAFAGQANKHLWRAPQVLLFCAEQAAASPVPSLSACIGLCCNLGRHGWITFAYQRVHFLLIAPHISLNSAVQRIHTLTSTHTHLKC